MPRLELFHLPGACSRVTLTALEMTGAPFQVTVPRDRADLAKPDYKKRNPFGQVPLLIFDDQPLMENIAILATLARLYPEAGLIPTNDSWLASMTLSRMATCASQLHPTMTRILFPQLFCDSSPEALERTRALALGMMRARLAAIESGFGDKWWLGDTFTIADPYLLWITNRLVLLDLDDLTDFPKLKAHVARVKATEAAQRVLAREAEYVAEQEAAGAQLPPFLRPAMAA